MVQREKIYFTVDTTKRLKEISRQRDEETKHKKAVERHELRLTQCKTAV